MNTEDKSTLCEVRGDRSWWLAFSWGTVLLSTFIFFYRSYRYGGYLAEDAYITFRYARNLAEGYGLVWNIGGARVEGYTSPLHVALLAVGVKLGLPFSLTSILISFLSVVGIIGIYWWLLRKEAGHLTIIGALIISVYLIDARLAIHATAGLDTVMYMGLLAGCYAVSIWHLEWPTQSSASVLSLANVLCLLGRPDAAPYIAGQVMVIMASSVYEYATHKESPLLRYSLLSYGFLLLIGSAYLAWKVLYFGYLLPNPFYLKSNEYLSFYGLGSVIHFLKSLKYVGFVLLCSLPFLHYSRLFAWWRGPFSKEKLALSIVPPSVFLLYYTTVIPEVNYANRFEYPTYFFFCVAAAMLLSAGSPIANVHAKLSRVLDTRVIAAAFGVGGLLFMYHTYKATYMHFPWFRIMEEEYYRPIGEALQSTNLGPKATLVFSSAGVVPFTSTFAHIDPVGLTDNVLSGRQGISVWDREHYIWGKNPDVYIGPEPPATVGAMNCSSDPVIQSKYVQEVLLAKNRYRIESAYLRTYGQLSSQEVCAVIHMRMRELRDRWSFLGEIPYPLPQPKRYTTFAYVRNGSPYFDDLVAALEPLLSRGPGEIDLDAPPRPDPPAR